MGWSPCCYIPSFMEIGQVLENKIFEGFLLYMGVAAILVMWPRCREQTFVPPYPRRLHIEFCFDWPCGFGGEDVWNCWRQTDRRRMKNGRLLDGYTKSSPCEPTGSGELIKFGCDWPSGFRGGDVWKWWTTTTTTTTRIDAGALVYYKAHLWAFVTHDW